jgi:hypothetical protein
LYPGRAGLPLNLRISHSRRRFTHGFQIIRCMLWLVSV